MYFMWACGKSETRRGEHSSMHSLLLGTLLTEEMTIILIHYDVSLKEFNGEQMSELPEI
jgi:hypothetical protein